jgi:mono/diheme cytochrome c family protein
MIRSLLFVVSLIALPSVAGAQAKDSLPSGVTPAMVAEGKTLYGGAGLCAACHGAAGKGVQGLGADLTDAKWLHSDGSFEAVAKQILTGVTPEKSSTGVAMPAKGGGQLSDAQVRAVAAYVWTLGRAAAK